MARPTTTFCGVVRNGNAAPSVVNAPEVAHHIEMQRSGFDILGPAFTQTVQMPSVAVSFKGGQD